jgi:hypothetical protein
MVLTSAFTRAPVLESPLRRRGVTSLDRLRAAGRLRDGELVTVDGHLGIVTVGPPELDLELA